jgi:hypothetical protein
MLDGSTSHKNVDDLLGAKAKQVELSLLFKSII